MGSAIIVALASMGLMLLGLVGIAQFRLAYRVSGRGSRLLLDNRPTLTMFGIALPLIALVDWLILGAK